MKARTMTEQMRETIRELAATSEDQARGLRRWANEPGCIAYEEYHYHKDRAMRLRAFLQEPGFETGDQQ